MLSLREFAKLAGVSRTTVSRAFSNSDKVAPATRKQLFELAATVGFRPSPVMRPATRGGGRTHSVGVLYPGYRASFFQDIQRGIQDDLLSHGILPIMLAVDVHNMHQCLNRLVDHRIDGLVTTSAEEAITQDDLQRLRKMKLATVWLASDHGRSFPQDDSVNTDDYQGGMLAARHLIDLGHRRIGLGYPKATNRLDGFLAELARHGLTVEPDCRVDIPNPAQPEFRARVVDLLSGSRRPTAIFCWTDLEAAVFYQVAHQLHVAIPRELSIVGYADLNFAPLLSPPLTTIRQNGYALGQRAAELIVARIGGDSSPPRQELIPAQLIVRQSTAPPT